jgi:hypothetical protein
MQERHDQAYDSSVVLSGCEATRTFELSLIRNGYKQLLDSSKLTVSLLRASLWH